MKRRFLFQTCITVLMFAGPWLVSPALAAWNIETIDSNGFMGDYTSIALDAGGNAHISYSDAINGDLKYAAFNGSSWDIQTVDSAGNVGDYASLALDTSGNPHISYRHGYGKLMYAAFNGSTWDIETVESFGPGDPGDICCWTSLAIDATHNSHISYYAVTNRDLNYAASNGSTWDIETVDSTGNVADYVSLALDTSGNPHISYRDNTNRNLKYAYVYHCEYVLAGDLNDNCIVDFLDVQTFVNTCWLSAAFPVLSTVSMSQVEPLEAA